MGKVIIETKDNKELKLKTFLTSEQVEKLIKEIEKKEKAKKLISSTFGTIRENEELEKKSEIQWYEQ